MAAERLEELRKLQEEVFQCERCIGASGCRIELDPQRVRRVLVPRALESDVFLVGQALGGKTQRRSGLPYCNPNGSLSQAGRRLDGFLGTFGYTIDPEDLSRRYAYSSDVIQHYPGRVGRGDRKPTRAERNHCAEWLKRELLLVQPKLIVLLGGVVARDFLERYAGTKVRDMEEAWGRRFECVIDRLRVTAFPVHHFSYRFGGQRTVETRGAVAKEIRLVLSGPRGSR